MKKKSWTCIIGMCNECTYKNVVCFQSGPESGAWSFDKETKINLRET